MTLCLLHLDNEIERERDWSLQNPSEIYNKNHPLFLGLIPFLVPDLSVNKMQTFPKNIFWTF